MTPDAAAWVREHVLVHNARITAPRAGGPCHCQPATPWICNDCRAGDHDRCNGGGVEWSFEKSIYGPGLSWPPRATVWLADRVCKTRCTCRRCCPPAAQLDLFGGAL
ncbi:hypothetical protein [Streptomyces sp. H27-C3]|uniref:hypothetical protein n=1 Tax=Streptomyces sp. H27-C3 TaxID=3046305 RepID=UPI0024BB8810|nr:hypothetical protein [Streptomyces sp. H27-C3]MDJ0460637.1 hypothetical protein [Streptomyces sp. H27-C3]